MADHMQLIVTLRKVVEDEAEARALLNQLKTLLANQPDIILTAHTSNHYDVGEEPQ